MNPMLAFGKPWKPFQHVANELDVLYPEVMLEPLAKREKGARWILEPDLFSASQETISVTIAIIAAVRDQVFFVHTHDAEKAYEYFCTTKSEKERTLLLSKGYSFPPKNLWVGSIARTRQEVGWQMLYLSQIKGANCFLLIEPQEEIQLDDWLHIRKRYSDKLTEEGLAAEHMGYYPNYSYQAHECVGISTHPIKWLVVTGGAKPAHPNWYRSLRDQARAAQIPFYFASRGVWTWDKPNPIDGKPAYPEDGWGVIDQVGDFSPNTTAWNGITGNDSPMRETYLYRVGVEKSGMLLDDVEHAEIPGEVL